MRSTELFIAAVLSVATGAGMASSIETSIGFSKGKERKGRAILWDIGPGNEDGCRPFNTSCVSHSDCCGPTDLCIGVADEDSVCRKCTAVHENCTGDDTKDICCHLFDCQNGKCVCTKEGEECFTHNNCCGTSVCSNRKLCRPCSNADEPCEDNYGCCNGRCNVKDRVCYCSPDGLPCTSSGECCADLICSIGFCEKCVRFSGACRHDKECCSNNCSMGVCNCRRKSSRKKRCTVE